MAKRDMYESQAEKLLEPIVETYGCEIYDVEYVKEGSEWYLRAYIDKPDGVNIIDCENVSRAFSKKLDEEDFIPDAYILEVSSPGLGRALRKDRHFEKSLGKEVEVKLFKPVQLQIGSDMVKSKEFTGILKGYDKESVSVEIRTGEGEDMSGVETDFARSDIALIKLTFDFGIE